MTDGPVLPKSLQERIELYERAMALHRRGLTSGEIRRALGVSWYEVGSWLRGIRPKRVRRYEPDLSPRKALAYVAGFYLGDGKEAGEEHKDRFGLADPEQLQYVGGLVAKLLGRSPKPLGMDGGFYVVQYDSVVLSDFLHHDIEWLAEYLKDFVPDFLRGFFDAEGYVSAVLNLRRASLDSMVVGAANTNTQYLETVRALLFGLGIRSSIRATNKRGQTMTIRGKTWIRRHDVFHCIINGWDDGARFQNTVGFRNKAKAEKLGDLISLKNKPPRSRYDWFTTNYAKRGRRWLKIRK